mgnify:CR=1
MIAGAGVRVKSVPVKMKYTFPGSDPSPALMAFDAVSNNLQHLVPTANVKGLEPLLPSLSDEGGWLAFTWQPVTSLEQYDGFLFSP